MVIWPWSRFRRMQQDLDVMSGNFHRAQERQGVETERADEWKKRYIRVNDEYSAFRLKATDANEKLLLTTKDLEYARKDVSRLEAENEMLRLDHRRAVEQLRQLANSPQKITLEADPFKEDATQTTQFVDAPHATPDEIMDHVARAQSWRSEQNTRTE